MPAVSSESGIKCTNPLPADSVEPSSENSISRPMTGPRIQTGPLLQNPPPVASFMPPFHNIPHPPPSLPLPNVPRGPVIRIRLPLPSPKGPAEDFPHPGVMEAEHWNGRPFRNNGPPRGPPEWFGPEPPFRPRGWSRGGPWGHGQFRN